MKDNQQKNWEARYNAGNTSWDRGGNSPQLKKWLDSQALTPCRILVPGCGNGYEVITLATAGFEVVAIDIAPSPIKQLRAELSERALSAEILQADLLQWQSAQPFAAIYEQTSLCALEPNTWQQYEQQFYSWLEPGGKMFTLLMQTNKKGGPPYHCDLADMQTLFAPERWQWSGTDGEVSHPAGFYELAHILEKT
jgi:2-polyprenyl-3-methyl-5-hydroxy-6-metoxy-1,4-benzoquinol methylase